MRQHTESHRFAGIVSDENTDHERITFSCQGNNCARGASSRHGKSDPVPRQAVVREVAVEIITFVRGINLRAGHHNRDLPKPGISYNFGRIIRRQRPPRRRFGGDLFGDWADLFRRLEWES